MKPVIPIAAAFIVGLAGSTVVGMRRPASAADSTAVAAPAEKPKTPATDSLAEPKPTTDSAKAPATEAAVPAPAPIDTAHHADTMIAATQRLVGVFAKLSGKDIAPIAEGMPDSSLVPVLKVLGTAKSAEILAALPAARAKTLSRLLLTPGRGTTP